jgi:hypothetical protein
MKDAVAKSRISRLMLKNKQAAEAKLMSKADIAKGREARIAAGCPTSADLSSMRMKNAMRDKDGRRISIGQQLKERERGSDGQFIRASLP